MRASRQVEVEGVETITTSLVGAAVAVVVAWLRLAVAMSSTFNFQHFLEKMKEKSAFGE